MKRDQPNPILYLYEYSQVPEEILYRKNDEELSPWSQIDNIGTAGEKTLFSMKQIKKTRAKAGARLRQRCFVLVLVPIRQRRMEKSIFVC